MKKLSILLTFLFCSVTLFAQVNYSEKSLKEIVKQAKTENKNVLIICSASWCGPCKSMESFVLSTPETGDYINSKFIAVKYLLDKNDPENIVKNYEVGAYPTLIVLNNNGEEMNRLVGFSAGRPAAFNKQMEDLVNAEENLITLKAKFEADKKDWKEYVYLLHNAGLNKKAEDVYAKVFESRKVSENYNSESLEYYNTFILNHEHFAIKYMLTNSKEVTKVMGKEQYKSFMLKYANKQTFEFIKKEDYASVEQEVKRVNAQPLLKNFYSEFLLTNIKNIKTADFENLYAEIDKNGSKFSSEEVGSFVTLLFNIGKKSSQKGDVRDNKQFTQSSIKTYRFGIKYSKNEEDVTGYKRRLTMFGVNE